MQSAGGQERLMLRRLGVFMIIVLLQEEIRSRGEEGVRRVLGGHDTNGVPVLGADPA